MKKIIACLLFLTILVGCSNSAEFSTKVSDDTSAILVIEGTEITKQSFYEYLMKDMGASILEEDTFIHIIKEVITDQDLIDTKINELYEDYLGQLGDDVDTFLVNNGYKDLEDFKEKLVVPHALVSVMMDKYTEDNFDALVTEYKFRDIKHIEVETDTEALEVLKRLDDGEDFATVAKDVSTDTSTSSKGGELGLVHTSTTSIDENIIAAVTSIDEIGLMNSFVTTKDGFSIVYVNEVDATILKDKIMSFFKSSSDILTRTKTHYFKEYDLNIYENYVKDSFKNYMK